MACYCEYGAEVSPTGKLLVDIVIEFRQSNMYKHVLIMFSCYVNISFP
jgi:hypothetical protein